MVAFTIQDVADKCGLTQHTLRWYERIGLLDRIERGTDGRRRFSTKDLNWIDLIVKLRSTGMPIAAMKRYAELVRGGGDGNEAERIALLEEHRARVRNNLAAQQECLDILDRKITTYRERQR